jgi:hypothetical protein
VLPDPITKADGDVGLGGEGKQQLRVNSLDVAGVLAKDRHGPLRGPWCDFPDGLHVLGDRTARVALGPAVDRVDLNRVRQVVGEIDHHSQADEK